MSVTPATFSYLYPNDKTPGQSLSEKVDLANTSGCVLRDSESRKFLYFESHRDVVVYFGQQEKPYLHSVINKHKPVRLNLELDITPELLENIVFPPDIVKKIEADGQDLQLIKSLKCFEHVKDVIGDVLDEYYGIESSDYIMMTASDNRKGVKYSYRVYMKLAFANIREYRYFVSLVQASVKQEVLPMIDPTTLMLRTPGSYKDNHVCTWRTPECTIEDALLDYTDNCDVLKAIAPEEEQDLSVDTLTDDITKRAVGMLSAHKDIMGNFYYTETKNGFLQFKRTQPSECGVCERVHDNIDGYATIHRGHVYWRCFRTPKKFVYIGFLEVPEVLKFRWADLKNMMLKYEKSKTLGLTNKERCVMANDQQTMLDEVIKKAKENEQELEKVEKYYYTDAPKFHKKTFNDDKQVIRWVEQTIAKVMMGGNSLFITSDYWKDTKHFTEMSMLPCSRKTESYYCTLINPNVDVNEPFDSGKKAKNPMLITRMLEDIINEYTMMNFYKAVDFVPYLVDPNALFAYKKVHNYVHFDTKEELKKGLEKKLKELREYLDYRRDWYEVHKNDVYDGSNEQPYWQYPIMGDNGDHESKFNATSQYYITAGLEWLVGTLKGYKKGDRLEYEDDLDNLDKCFAEANIDTGTRFEQEKKPSREIFNMFEGFKFPYSATKEINTSIQPWIDHILNIVCDGNAECAKKLTQWLAHIIQKPTEKSFATIIYGEQGVGKSILYEFFIRCIGRDLALQVGTLENLTMSHNTHVRGKMIINCNEATNEPTNRDVNILKGLITETDLIINPKGVNQYTVSNYSRLLLTSNYKRCMRLDGDDRRYFCLQISNKKKNNDEYFAPLVASLKDDAIQQAFFNYLANYDISDFHPQRPPMTELKRDMIGDNANNVVLFLKDVCENQIYGLEYDNDTVEITPRCTGLFTEYKDWCKHNDEKGSKQNATAFKKYLKNEFGIGIYQPDMPDGSKPRRHKINRETLLDKFKTKFCNVAFAYSVS